MLGKDGPSLLRTGSII